MCQEKVSISRRHLQWYFYGRTLHPPKGLGQLSGVAALLRFPLPNLNESDEEDLKEDESTK